jgi:ABC-type transport system substrate-binding protein
MSRNVRDRVLDLEIGKADFAEISPEQARRAADAGVRTSASQLDELVALVFVSGRPSAENARIREALASSLDRAAMVNFILQKQGELAGGLLPQWSDGTAFLFSTVPDIAHSKELWSQIGPSTSVVLGYDSGDSLNQSLAERIVVNARDAGINLVVKALPAARAVSAPAPFAAANPGVDVQLVHWRMPSASPVVAMNQLLGASGALSGADSAPLPSAASAEQIYERERMVVGSYRMIPLVWLPQIYGLSARVKDWKPPAPGEPWPLADVWLDAPAGSMSVQ